MPDILYQQRDGHVYRQDAPEAPWVLQPELRTRENGVYQQDTPDSPWKLIAQIGVPVRTRVLATGQSPTIEVPPAPTLAERAVQGLQRGTISAGRAIAGVGEIAGQVVNKVTGWSGLEQASRDAAAGMNAPGGEAAPSLKDVWEGKAGVGEFLVSGVTESLPQMAATIAAGGGALAAGGGAVAAGAAAGTLSYLLNTGDLYQGLRDKGVNPRNAAIAAGVTGVPIAALDSIEPLYLLLRGTGKSLGQEAARTFAQRIGAHATSAGIEAGTEMGQEGLAAAAETATGVGPDSRELAWRVAGAGVLAGVMGAGASAIVPTSKQREVAGQRAAGGPIPDGSNPPDSARVALPANQAVSSDTIPPDSGLNITEDELHAARDSAQTLAQRIDSNPDRSGVMPTKALKLIQDAGRVTSIQKHERPYLTKLKTDIATNGMEPIILFKDTHGKYGIEDGHHRLAAAVELGVTDLPVVVKERGARSVTPANRVPLALAPAGTVPVPEVAGVPVPVPEALREAAVSTPPQVPVSEEAPAVPDTSTAPVEAAPVSVPTAESLPVVEAPPIDFEPVDLAEVRNAPLVSFGYDNSDVTALGLSLGTALTQARTNPAARARITLAAADIDTLGFNGGEVAAIAAEAAHQIDPTLPASEIAAAARPLLERAKSDPELRQLAVQAIEARLAAEPAAPPVVDHAQMAREAKAGKLVDLLYKHGINSIDVPLIPSEQWPTLAKLAGVNLPSPETVALVQRLLKVRELGDESTLHANPARLVRNAVRYMRRRQLLAGRMPAEAKRLIGLGSRFQRNMLTARQLARLAPDFVPIQVAVQAAQDLNTLANYVKLRGELVVKKWRRLSAANRVTLTKFSIEAQRESRARGRKLTVAELAALPTKLTPDLQQAYQDTQAFFDQTVSELRTALARRVAAQAGKGNAATANELAQIESENFFPTWGAGKWLVLDNTTNEVIRVETEAEMQTLAASRRTQGHNVGTDTLTPEELAFASVPHQLIPDLIESLPIGKVSRERLKRLAYTDSTSSVGRFDAERAIAQFAVRMGNFIGRTAYRGELRRAVDMAQELGNQQAAAGQDATETRAAETWLREFEQHVLNPVSHFQALKGALLVKFFFAVPKQAAINVTQLPLATLPRLEAFLRGTARVGPVTVAKPGLLEATPILAKAIHDSVRMMIDPQYAAKAPLDERMMLSALTGEGILDQTHASTLATVMHGFPLENLAIRSGLPPGMIRDGAHFVRTIIDHGLLMFKATEENNRRATALAAFRAAKRKGHADPVGVARQMVLETQGSYEGWNKPALFRNKGADMLYIYKAFQQNQLFMFRHVPGGVKGMFYLATVAGLMALPFADDVADLTDALVYAAGQALGKANRMWDTRQALRTYFDTTFVGSEVAMNGITRGELSLFDLSGSLSMGSVIPAVEPFSKGLTGRMSPDRAALRIVEELSGLAGSQGLSFLRSAMTADAGATDWLRSVEPEALRSILESYDVAMRARANDGKSEYRTHRGDPLVPFDLHDSWQQAELIGRLLGFTPARVSREREIRTAAYEQMQYYTVRRELAINTMMAAIVDEKINPDAKREAMNALERFNKDVPAAFRLPNEFSKIKELFAERLVNREKRGLGLPTEERYLQLFDEVRRSFGQPSLAERANGSAPATSGQGQPGQSGLR